jgi:sugar lactone lactonase YvrE
LRLRPRSTSLSGDGGPATAAALGGPGAPALDAAGNLYIPEYDNRVRRVDAAGVIRTIGGTGVEATSGDGGPAVLAALMHPHGLDATPDGTVFVAETWVDKVRRIDGATGLISTVAGTGQRGSSGDGGPATSALFNVPIDVTIGPGNSLYVTDGGNGRIRRIDAAGRIATVAGNGSSTSSGDGGRATNAGLALPNSIAVAADGTFYVAEFEGRRVRRVDGASGIITTIAG